MNVYEISFVAFCFVFLNLVTFKFFQIALWIFIELILAGLAYSALYTLKAGVALLITYLRFHNYV